MLGLKQRRIARQTAGASVSCPVEVIDGDSPPKLVGESYYWTTPSGKTVVRYPGAYRWRTVYHASTRRVVVGRNWF